MKISKRYIVKPEKIHSLKDIELEKQRLRLEIMKTEASIQAEYHNILNAMTLKNIASNMFSDITSTSSIISKAFSFGKSLMAKRKKKKHGEGYE
ncbi:MAG: hypothetical protein WCP32_14870 [Bacteroidota bacterium]